MDIQLGDLIRHTKFCVLSPNFSYSDWTLESPFLTSMPHDSPVGTLPATVW